MFCFLNLLLSEPDDFLFLMRSSNEESRSIGVWLMVNKTEKSRGNRKGKEEGGKRTRKWKKFTIVTIQHNRLHALFVWINHMFLFQGAIQCLTIGLAPRVGCNTTYLKKYSRSRRLCSTNVGVNLPTTFLGGSLGILLFNVGYCLTSSSRNSTKSEYLFRTVIGAP